MYSDIQQSGIIPFDRIHTTTEFAMHDKFLLITAACYLAAGGFLYAAVASGSSSKRTISAGFALVGVIVHAWAEMQHWMAGTAPQFSLLNVLSLCALVTYPLKRNLYDTSLVALPLAILILFAEWLLFAPVLEISESSPGIKAHIITSVLAFGVLSVAGVYAVFITVIDHLLRRHTFNRIVQNLPALEILEELLFHLIRAGLVVLTVSLFTGLIYVSDLFGQHLVHKTTLSIFAWLIFALLLWGRWRRGWRGRVAVRMTLAGIVVLLLSYFGSKLILEIILERSWHI